MMRVSVNGCCGGLPEDSQCTLEVGVGVWGAGEEPGVEGVFDGRVTLCETVKIFAGKLSAGEVSK